jgi:hypothetical protein
MTGTKLAQQSIVNAVIAIDRKNRRFGGPEVLKD